MTAGSDAKSTLDVTVTVTNVDETGTVMMTARQPQVDKTVKASVNGSRRRHVRRHLVVGA